MKAVRYWIAFSSALLAVAIYGDAQTTPTPEPAPGEVTHSTEQNRSEHFAVGIKLSSLGLGAEAATSVSRQVNLRAGFNILGYGHTFTKDGIPYRGHLNFKTIEGHIDVFPWAGTFHVSPGILVYGDDPIKASAFMPANSGFSLGGATFYSDPSNPTTVVGRIRFHRAAPIITVGWGNLISRKEGSRFSFPFEIGVAFEGDPRTSLLLSGNVCTSPGANCTSAMSNPEVQRNIVSEQNKINSDLSFLKVYPIISSGFAVRF